MKRIPIFILFLMTISFCFAQNKKLDSLWAVYDNKMQADTNRLKALNDLAWSYRLNKQDTAILLAKTELSLAQKSKQRKYEGKALNIIGICLKNKGDYAESLEYFLKAFKIFEEIGNLKGLAGCYTNIGNIYLYQSNYPKALDCYLKSLKTSEQIFDKSGIMTSYGSLGNIYLYQSKYDKALGYYFKQLKIAEEIGEKKDLGNCYSNIGNIYFFQFNFPKSLEYYFKQLKIAEKIGDKRGMGNCYGNIGGIYNKQGQKIKAMACFFKSLQIHKEMKNKHGIVSCFTNMGTIYNEMGNYKYGIIYIDSGLQIGRQIGDIEFERLAYKGLATAYNKTGKYKEAYENHVKFKQLTDSIFNSENSKQLGDLKTNFEVQKKELELKAKADAQEAIAAEQKKRQGYIIFSVVGLLLIVLIFAVFMFNRFKVTQKQKGIIEKQKGIVEEQKHLVEEKQKEIVDSITYAKRLQQAILPSGEEIKKYFPDSFIYYKPKDIVAGDFYWMEHFDEITYIAAADSTGHGVPGAMVSVVCSNALNRAVKEFGLRETGKILDKTRELVLETFAKSGEEIKDGMDISLLSINKKKQQVEWSGANNQLWYISNNLLIEIKPDKQPIGKTDNPTPFTTHCIELKKADIFYLMTDGYADQFGGTKGKKFKYKQLEEKLLSISSNDLNGQKSNLESTFDTWKGNLEQVDDVTLIGIRV